MVIGVECPAAGEPLQGIVEARRDRHELRLRRREEVGAPVPERGQERAVLVEHDVRLDEERPRQVVGEPGGDLLVFRETERREPGRAERKARNDRGDEGRKREDENERHDLHPVEDAVEDRAAEHVPELRIPASRGIGDGVEEDPERDRVPRAKWQRERHDERPDHDAERSGDPGHQVLDRERLVDRDPEAFRFLSIHDWRPGASEGNAAAEPEERQEERGRGERDA